MPNTNPANLHMLNGEYFVLGSSFPRCTTVYWTQRASFESGTFYAFCLLVFIVICMWERKAKEVFCTKI